LKVTGGADRHVLDLAKLLRERGHAVRFLSLTDGGRPELGAFVPPTVTHDSRDRLRASEQLTVATRALWNRTAAAAMRRLISEFVPDVVQAHKLYPQLSVAPVHVAHEAGIPVIQWAHDYEFVAANPEDDHGGRVDRIESALAYRILNSATFAVRRFVHLPRVTRWLVASRFVASVYAEHNINCDVLKLFQLGAETAPPRYESRSGVVFSGRLTETKGVRDVVEMARHVPKLEITVAGKGALQQYVEEAAQSLPNLRYEGLVDQATARRLVESARVVLVPSRWAEPAGRVALEAMAAGTPVVAFPNGGLKEYVSDSGGGLLVTQDPEALAAASMRICCDPDLWRTLSSRGLESVRRAHSPEGYLARLEAIYDQVVSTQPRSPLAPANRATKPIVAPARR
jgi:glycosyltransferase involved in cell wall biosynthesis